MPEPEPPPPTPVGGWKDILWRLMWTAIAAILGSLSASALFDVAAWKAAAMAGLTAVINFGLLIARQKANGGP